MIFSKRRASTVLTACLASGLGASPNAIAVAQQADDVVVVTGTFIRRQDQSNLPSPLESVGAGDIEDVGAVNVSDITETLTINTGAENNPDAFTQNQTTGTSSINLRGLGLASTLVLLDGHRQVTTAAQSNDGVSFVDTASLVPLIAIERIEILKDGASALYGSDAVAGVVNFITRENYDGVLGSVNYLAHPQGGSYDETLVQGLFGKTFDTASVLGAVSYTRRNALTTEERRLSRVGMDDVSVIGNPGAFLAAPPTDPLGAAPAGAPVIDPTGCAEVGGVPLPASPTAPPPSSGIGFCGFDFGDYYSLVPEEEKLLFFGKAEFDVTDTIHFQAEVGYADNEATRNNSPTFPYLLTPIVPASNPFNVFAQDAVFIGRVLGNGGEAATNGFDSETFRTSLTLTGDAFRNGYWEMSYVYGQNEHVLMTPDVIADRFQCSLFGFDATTAALYGITSCGAVATDAAAAGVAGETFNPFATSFTVAPNSDELVDFLIGTQVRETKSELNVINALVSTDLAELAAGPVSIAIGTQYRKEELEGNFDEISLNDGFGFLIGEQPYSGTQNILAVFGELSVPVTDMLDLQFALRFEDYEDIGSTTDPKVAALFRPNDWLSLRASYSTSFRAPSTFQLQGQSTSLEQVSDPANGGATAFAAVRTLGNEDLKPEESDAFNIGFSLRPASGLELDVDYFNFDFTDVIVQENPQSLLLNDPLDPAIIRGPGGNVQQIFTDFVNASSLKTSGVDVSASYPIDIREGTLTPTFTGTYLLEYELEDPTLPGGSGTIDGAGRRNFNNFGTSAPEIRFNAGLLWESGPHAANVFARYIDEYVDDEDEFADTPVLRDIDSQTRVDIQYSLQLGELMERAKMTRFTAGVRNLLDEEPPQVFTNGGYDSKVHDPRGRMLYLAVDHEF
ncbi:hypothetical protein PB2503_03077 [Parvularcula bermudensis HTCC2503]|uniref:TonB-dependent receptor n=1 Tax=Parvularcula bermudensis (strain ATCC BAA-594 / HTCC2503 / KCTC 12087) TaxID=314260 RepID=E0TD33_PARBH|nr:TonB-dependent receptor [Parvularcula bermudensis]ADM08692.1 hypothetical protein PB2503_03077 [Parvularcula bermudensis HTCC2503]